MASNYTTNYGLCQWEPGDKFLREEFNQDNEKLDTVLERAEGKADRALSGLEAADYNLYNLILQSDYEGKHTGWKKALLFDGFRDRSGVLSLGQGLLLSDGAVALSKNGQSNYSLGYGAESDRGGKVETRAVTVSGCGRLTGMNLRLRNGLSWETSVETNYEIQVNGMLCESGASDTPVIPAYSTGEGIFPFQKGVEVKPGDVVVVRLDLHSAWRYAVDSGGSNLGGTLRFTPISATSGTITTRTSALPAGEGVRLWVRHKGGSVTAALTVDDRPCTLIQSGQRNTLEPQHGVSCTETAFSFNGETASGNIQLKLTLSLGGDSTMALYDYGLLLL